MHIFNMNSLLFFMNYVDYIYFFQDVESQYNMLREQKEDIEKQLNSMKKSNKVFLHLFIEPVLNFEFVQEKPKHFIPSLILSCVCLLI